MQRAGFTLMELLIVLAIIVMVVSIGTPSVVQLLDRAKFRDGVLELQSELGRTRTSAMKSGTALVFRYRIGTGEYQIFPKNSAETNVNAFQTTDIPPTKHLPERVLFMGGTVMDADTFQIPATHNTEESLSSDGSAVGTLTNPPSNSVPFTPPAVSPFPDSQKYSEPGWSKPIIFFPNGRTSTAVIFLRSPQEQGKQNYYSEISFRGMTGSARVSTISTYPPGTPEFPSVLSERAFARLAAENRPSSPEGVIP